MPRNNMPDSWQPPAPAWQSFWRNQADPLIAGCYGVQASSPGPLDAWAAPALAGSHPLAVERGSFIDGSGVRNHLYIAYWRKSQYDEWWSLEANARWWADPERLSDGVGYWREVITMPFERFETLHSTQCPHGVGVCADGMEGPILEHGYPGSMRDRIPLSDDDDLRNGATVDARLPARISDGGRRIVVTPPERMCVIRSGQDWSDCTPEQKKWYLDKLHPVLLDGMRYLRDNPREAGCYSLRFVDRSDWSWEAMEQSFGLGYATDVHAFEEWAKSHPTHQAIFDGFMDMVDAYGDGLRLRLWHDVTALPDHGCEFEYIGCHSQTGLLGYRRAN
ncbi:MAG: phenylacetaldoxime dehydratase family protein [Gammaproteobacteria bacterium]|nr:phenylacetaldoxime dehydratase family protein [Gammaproteobacteria bacterium]